MKKSLPDTFVFIFRAMAERGRAYASMEKNLVSCAFLLLAAENLQQMHLFAKMRTRIDDEQQ